MAWDPFDELRRMRDEINKIFNRLSFELPILGKSGKEIVPYRGFRTPEVDIEEKDDKIIANIELPGVSKDDIELNVNEDSIEVKAQKKIKKETKKEGFYSYEARSAQFYRRIPLPTEVVPSSAEAVYKDGLLTVEVPKVKKLEHKKGKRIKIK